MRGWSQLIFFNQIQQNEHHNSIIHSPKSILQIPNKQTHTQTMNRQGETRSQQLQIDNQMYRLKRENPKIQFKEMAELINYQFKTAFTVNDLINRWETMEKPCKDVTIAIFNEFRRYQIDFVSISQRTGTAVTRVKRQILAGLVNNIWKVCFIVRKRNISYLKSNFISTKNIKNLVIMILKSTNFRNVKEEYSMLWNFISQSYEETYFKTVSNQNYKLVYRQLIILAEKLKIKQKCNEAEQGFERKILQQNGKDHQNQIFAVLNEFKRKGKKETIDLVSQEQENEGKLERDMPPQSQSASNQVVTVYLTPALFNQIICELISLYSCLSELNRMVDNGCDNWMVKQEMTLVTFKICCIHDILKY